jgi:hypothetical protein
VSVIWELISASPLREGYPLFFDIYRYRGPVNSYARRTRDQDYGITVRYGYQVMAW